WAGIEYHPGAPCRAAPGSANPPLISFEFRLALFEERPDALTRILGLRHEQKLAVEVVKRGAEVHVLLAIEGIAAEAQGDRRFPGQRIGDLLDGGVELLVRNDLVDHTQRLQPERCPAVSEHLHLEQDLA